MDAVFGNIVNEARATAAVAPSFFIKQDRRTGLAVKMGWNDDAEQANS